MRKILLFLIISTMTAAVEFKGYIKTKHAAAIKSENDILISESNLNLEMSQEIGDSKFFATIDYQADYLDNKPEIKELYHDYYGENFTLRIGKQIIPWGKADGIKITDIVSPYDYSQYQSKKIEESRIGVEAIKLNYTTNLTETELIWIPMFTPSSLPEEESKWYLFNKYNFEKTDLPKKNIKNSEIGAKSTIYLDGIDISISGFYMWNDNPIYKKEIINDKLILTPFHHRIGFIGIDLSASVGKKTILRSEIAYFSKDYFAQYDNKLIDKPIVKSMIGLDYYPGDNWTITQQFILDTILNYNNKIIKDENQFTYTLSISKKLFREQLELKNQLYYNHYEKSYNNKFEIDYTVIDGLHYMLALDIYGGEKGLNSEYKNYSNIWISAKYSF